MSNFNQTQVDKKLLKLLQRILIQLHLIFLFFLNQNTAMIWRSLVSSETKEQVVTWCESRCSDVLQLIKTQPAVISDKT